MIDGHGDDIHQYAGIRVNFSSNVYNHFKHDKLFGYLADRLSAVRNYPEPAPERAEQALATAIGLRPSQVMLTNGATEAIYLVSQAFRRGSSAILIPTFSEYADACGAHEHTTTLVTRLEDVPAETQTVWLCNPNNPTGLVYDKDRLLRHVSRRPGTLFVVDASYAPFTRQPLVTPTEAVSLPNLVMLHSMTKAFAVPGLRLGYITANEPLLGKVRRQRWPWSVGTMAQDACRYLVAHRDDYQLPLGTLLGERERMSQALTATGAVTPQPSHTHILLCELRRGRAADLKDLLAKRHGILIRDAANFEGLSDRHFRIAVQTPAENDLLLRAMSDIFSRNA